MSNISKFSINSNTNTPISYTKASGIMEIQKELSEISWNVTEDVYRANEALSYSILSKYEREGFNRLDHLYDSISSQALLEGSMVDCLITSYEEEFCNQYYIADLPALGEKESLIVNALYERFHLSYERYSYIPIEMLLSVADEFEYQKNWKTNTRLEGLEKKVAMYYNLKVQAGDKTIVDRRTYERVAGMVAVLKGSTATKGYFAPNDELSPIRRYYQLKFRARYENVDYRIMADLLVVDYEDKVITPIDLKTSGHKEWDFQDSFEQWNYMIQARLYWRIIKANLLEDPYFKDFKLENYKFIVVNKESLTPLVWEFPLTTSVGTLVNKDGKEFRDPFEIGKELQSYLNFKPEVPVGIDKDGVNIINCLQRKI